MGNENNIKVCPFFGEACKEDKCTLWTEIGVMRPGMIAPQKEGMCAFPALVLLIGTPRPQMIQQGAKLKL
jgi:hypothetical protein